MITAVKLRMYNRSLWFSSKEEAEAFVSEHAQVIHDECIMDYILKDVRDGQEYYHVTYRNTNIEQDKVLKSVHTKKLTVVYKHKVYEEVEAPYYNDEACSIWKTITLCI